MSIFVHGVLSESHPTYQVFLCKAFPATHSQPNVYPAQVATQSNAECVSAKAKAWIKGPVARGDGP